MLKQIYILLSTIFLFFQVQASDNFSNSQKSLASSIHESGPSTGLSSANQNLKEVRGIVESLASIFSVFSPIKNLKNIIRDTKLFNVISFQELAVDTIVGRQEKFQPLQDALKAISNARKGDAKAEYAHTGGILLYGKPGTGKTQVSNYIAKSLNLNIMRVSAADIKKSEDVKELFYHARFYANYFDFCTNKSISSAYRFAANAIKGLLNLNHSAVSRKNLILLIEEIDSFAIPRSDKTLGTEEGRIVNEFLSQLGEPKNKEILIVATTNCEPKNLDEAFMRPGRFDLKIESALPDKDTILTMILIEMEKLINSDYGNKNNMLRIVEDDMVRIWFHPFVLERLAPIVDCFAGKEATGAYIKDLCKKAALSIDAPFSALKYVAGLAKLLSLNMVGNNVPETMEYNQKFYLLIDEIKDGLILSYNKKKDLIRKAIRIAKYTSSLDDNSDNNMEGQVVKILLGMLNGIDIEPCENTAYRDLYKQSSRFRAILSKSIQGMVEQESKSVYCPFANLQKRN